MGAAATDWLEPPADLGLAPGEVHAWRLPLDRGPEEVRRLRGWLAPEELARADRFRAEVDRVRFAVGRGLVRKLLGHYLGVEPARLTFAYGPLGKPEVAGSGLGFNLAHTGGLALLAVARGRRVGIDLEAVRGRVDADQIVARYFAPGERAQYAALPEPGRAEGFFRAWTRKEAYIKATGEGFSRPLASFEVSLAAEGPALLAVEGDPDEPGRWTLRNLDPAPGLLAALAVEGAGWTLRRFVSEPEGPGP